MSSEWIVVISHRLYMELLIFLKAFGNKVQEMVFVRLRYLWRRRSNWPLCPWERQLDWGHLTSLEWAINHWSDSDAKGQCTTLCRRRTFERKKKKKKGYVGIYLNFLSFKHDLNDFSKPFLTKHGHVLIGCQGDLVYSGHTGLQLLPFTELLPEFS